MRKKWYHSSHTFYEQEDITMKNEGKKNGQYTEATSSGMTSGAIPQRRFRTYDEAFKRQAVKLVQENKRSVSVVAREVGIHENNLCHWVEEFGIRRSVIESPIPYFTRRDCTKYER
jgi:transcriptional regulator with PAS, ATPase and Fis domain